MVLLILIVNNKLNVYWGITGIGYYITIAFILFIAIDESIGKEIDAFGLHQVGPFCQSWKSYT